ncbi:MAG TPA: PD-(D/E)XK nuclease family protein [Solirubrobacteraceae bacterium]|nr:PD-(D/E)XK nuclease family protein [Solirubrobacteraceae bacterium]
MRDHPPVSLTLITGPANSAKAGMVLERYRALAARAPLLVVPTVSDAAHYRRELAESGAVLGARVTPFSGLIDELARRAGISRAPIGRSARLRVAAAVAAEAPLSQLRESATLSGFAHALVDLVTELEGHRVSPARLSSALRSWAASDAQRERYAEEVVALYSAYRRRLQGLGRTDAELRATEAMDALRVAPARWGASPVLFYGFDELTATELDAVETLARVVDTEVVFSLSYEPGRNAFAGRAGTFALLSALAGQHVALPARAEHYDPQSREALHHLERSLFETPSGTPRPPADAIRLCEAGGERAELELVGAQIVELLRSGMAPGDIAVVMRSPESSMGLIAQVFGELGIPHSARTRLAFADSAVGRGLLALLRCALLEGSALDLLTWLRTPGLLRRPELADRLEQTIRREGLRAAAPAIERWEAEHWPLSAVSRLRQAGAEGSRALLRAIGAELAWLFAAPHHRRAATLSTLEVPDASALRAGQRALEELAELGGHGGLTIGAAAIHEALSALELTLEPASPDWPAVSVLDPLALRARRVRALFMCGLQEGEFPATGRRHAFFSDQERRSLAEASGLVLDRREDELAVERFLFYATVSRAERLLVLSYRTADDDGRPQVPSLFVNDVADHFDDRIWRERRRRALGAVAWPGPPPGPRAQRQMDALSGPRAAPEPIAALRSQPVLRELRERPAWSASSLEAFSDCPVRWLLERWMSLQRLEADPEPLARGALSHAVLETTLRRLAEQEGSGRVTERTLPAARRLLAQALREHAPDFVLSADPSRKRAALRRLELDLERYLEQEASSGSSFAPRHFELGFGMPDDDSAEALTIGAHEVPSQVRIRGRIDRVDVDPSGRQAIVYDYKGRSAPEAGKWLSERRFQIALYMRAVTERLGLEVVGGLYQPLVGRDLRPRGALADDAAPELRCVSADRRSAAELESLIAEAVALAVETAGEARAGRLQSRPRTCTPAGRCAFPGLCRCE